MKISRPIRQLVGALIVPVILLGMPSVAPAKGSIEDHIVETETGVYYIVQPGDTLWDLSQKFADSPWLWPDLWNKNQQITNPHLIYPGDRIRLYRRTDQERVTTAPAPAPSRAVETFDYPGIDAVGFIREKALEPSGVIFDVKDAKVMQADYDIVYINPRNHSYAVGEKYTIYRTIPAPIRNPETKKDIGIQHLIMGVAEIIQVEPEVAVGKIVKTFRVIEVDDLVTPYLTREPIIEIKPSVPGLVGNLISNENHTHLIAQDNIAFINRGARDQIENGQYYTIYQEGRDRMYNADSGRSKHIRLPPQDMGRVIVLHTEQTTATVLITKSNSPIPAWTPVRTP